ncbi:hypothetical protein EIP91_004046 [Steccherinum ochraceum]|uniref:Uncharacterized protein n=1 Tax=Steccherinum ochraceum TaxID=92696 RepID=A0A4R0RFT6_9APHY|nr:hypothetical protein EIP91_004046 [Steccherinum ochraceum]
MSSMQHLTPTRQAWLQTGPPTYSPPEKSEGGKSGKKRAKSCDDESESGEEYTLTAYGDVSPEDPYVPLGSKRYNLRPRVSRPPLPGKKGSITKEYESSYARAVAEHLRKSQHSGSEPGSPTQDFRDFMESVRSARRKAARRMDSLSSRGDSSLSSSRASSSSPRTPGTPSPKNSPRYDASEYESPCARTTRVRRRLPLPTWD